MPNYQLDMDELRSAARELEHERNEFQTIISRINTIIAIGGSQQSPRIQREISEMGAILKELIIANEKMMELAKRLEKLAYSLQGDL